MMIKWMKKNTNNGKKNVLGKWLEYVKEVFFTCIKLDMLGVEKTSFTTLYIG